MRNPFIFAACVAGTASFLAFGAASAQADTDTDQVFLLTVKMYDVPTAGMSNSELLNEGQSVCMFLRQPHEFFADAGLQLMQMHPGWSVADAGHFAGAATGAWCPNLGPSS